MWLIIIAVALVVVGIIVTKDENAKKERNRVASLDARYREKYGCSLEEMRERVRSSPNIKKVADKIREKNPECYFVDWKGIWNYRTFDRAYLIVFSYLGISDIPDQCLQDFEDALEKELQLHNSRNEPFIPYIRRWNDNGETYFLRKDRLVRKKTEVKGQDW